MIPAQPAESTLPRDGGSVMTREMLWLYPVGPWIVAPLMVHDFFSLSLRQALLSVAGFYIPFVGFPAALHLAYAGLWPRRWDGLQRVGPRLLAHAAFTAMVIIPTALLLYPLKCLTTDAVLTRLHFVWTSLAISWCFVLPAALVQRLRQQRAEAEHRALEERRSRLSAQLQALQARLNPHFLFNSLNSVACLVSEDPAAAERVVERLAEILRYSLQGAAVQTVTLDQELSVVHAYLEVQAARFGPRLQHRCDCPADLGQAVVPPLCLQPLVENAVLHGAVAQRRGGQVAVTAAREGDELVLTVCDDGPGPGGSTHQGNGVSLSDLGARLRILYPDARERLDLAARPEGGCRATLRLPLSAGPGRPAAVPAGGG